VSIVFTLFFMLFKVFVEAPLDITDSESVNSIADGSAAIMKNLKALQ
jgi:hypothetical protein